MKRKVKVLYKGPQSGFTEEDSIAYWQSQSPKSRLDAVWELAVTACLMKGKKPDELRLQRTTAVIKRK